MHGAVVGVVIVIILLLLWGSIATRLLVINLDETDKNDNYNNQTIDDLKRLIDSGDVETSQLRGLVEQLERDFASKTTEINTCKSIKEQCGTDLAKCGSEKNICTGNLSQCTNEKSTCDSELIIANGKTTTCTGKLSQCTTEKGTCDSELIIANGKTTTCTGKLSQCTTEKGTCDSDLIIANGKILALEGESPPQGEAPTQGESPSPLKTTSSKTGQTIGITVAITLVVVGAIWMFMRRASAKTVPAVGMRPPDKFGRRTSFLPSGMIRGTRRLFSRSMAGTPPSESMRASDESYGTPGSANDHTTEFDEDSFRDDSEHNARQYGSLVPTNLELEQGRDRRAMAVSDIRNDMANAAATLTRAI